MSVDRNPETIELPEAQPSDHAREEAVFKAVTAFEKGNRRGGGPIRGTWRESLYGLFARPGLRMALTSAVVLALAVPTGLSLLSYKWRAQKFYMVSSEISGANSGTPSTQGKSFDTSRDLASSLGPEKPVVAPEVPAPASALFADYLAATKRAAQFADEKRRGRQQALAGAPDSFVGRMVSSKAKAGVRGDQGQASRLGLTASPENRDRFSNAESNGFREVAQDAVSTFSIDVDTASYSYMRASLARNVLPRKDSIRTEELINYFPYDYAPPASAEEPFATDISVMPNPWAKGRKLIRIGIKGYQLAEAERPAANLVFLVDTSGSMNQPDKLPLLRQSLEMLVDTLKPTDRVAIVAYAGSAGTVLEPTAAAQKQTILDAIDRLSAGGSTAGGEGLRLAYKLAKANFDPGAVNRVMLATDGDFNVGITSTEELKGFVERERASGIYLSVLGFGMGNLNDTLMQALAQNGNGVASHIDTLAEARKVLVEEASSSLFPIAGDVKIQVEFNPAAVSEYRLVGYETRLLKREDFNNDKIDAGEVGAGASVTAIYDIVPKGGPRVVDESRYQGAQGSAAKDGAGKTDEYAFVKIRYKLPRSDTSTLITRPVVPADEVKDLASAPQSARFAVAVAGFGEFLRGTGRMGDVTLDSIIQLANGAKGEDPYGYRAEFVSLVRAARTAPNLPRR